MMENLKIKVNKESESKEAQELFFKLGYGWFEKREHEFNFLDARYLLTKSRGTLHCTKEHIIFALLEVKEVTLQELRTMIKPQHKEYLDPHNNYELIEVDCVFMVQDHWIAVPYGAEILSSFNNGQPLVFHKQDFNYVVGADEDWSKLGLSYDYSKSAAIVWQRDTQPEAVNVDADSADELFTSASLESTLAERQASYGDFEDVAYTTESLVDVLKKANYDKMTKEQKMSLYMICSKMARLVNGNPAHKDSWHDIAGYSKLVEDSL